jgi:hypothetical protein
MNATVCCEILARAPGLKPIPPQGTMYMLVRVTVMDEIRIR